MLSCRVLVVVGSQSFGLVIDNHEGNHDYEWRWPHTSFEQGGRFAVENRDTNGVDTNDSKFVGMLTSGWHTAVLNSKLHLSHAQCC